MIQWLFKKTKVMYVKKALREMGVGGVYPDAIIGEVVEYTYDTVMQFGGGRVPDFDYYWNLQLSGYIKLLTMNASYTDMRMMVGKARADDDTKAIILKYPPEMEEVSKPNFWHLNKVLNRHRVHHRLIDLGYIIFPDSLRVDGIHA